MLVTYSPIFLELQRGEHEFILPTYINGELSASHAGPMHQNGPMRQNEGQGIRGLHEEVPESPGNSKRKARNRKDELGGSPTRSQGAKDLGTGDKGAAGPGRGRRPGSGATGPWA